MNKESLLKQINFKSFYSSELPSIKWNGNNQGIALCPFHPDKKESLSVNGETGLFFCHACNEGGDVFSFYQKRHNVDFRAALEELGRQAGVTTEPKKKIVKTYDYTDAEGNLIFQVVKYEPKDFRQRRADGKGGWTWNLQDVQLIPYNLPQLVKSSCCFLVEGEKDAESLKALGFVASCNPMGAGKWRPEYNGYFKDKKVFILPDNDTPGKNHALNVAKGLKGIASSIKIVVLSGLPEKGDVSDWIEARKKEGKTKEEIKVEFREIVKTNPEWTLPKEPDLLASLLKWNDILSLDIKTEYLIQNLIPKGSITLLFGRGGIGKTSLCLQVGRAIAEGLPFGDLQTIKTPVYYIDFENPLSVLKKRAENIGHTDNLWIWHISGNPMPPRLDSKDWGLYKQLPPGLLIFDTLRASHLLDENDSQDMAVVIGRLKELREGGFTILLLHHTPKGNEGIYKGSTALLDLVDHVLSIEGIKDADGEPIEFDKDNLYRLGVRIKTRYEPYHVFLKFNPDAKGFEFAKDPDIEKIETLYDILKDAGQLNQKDFKERVKSELDLTEREVRKLLKKGEGMAWDVERRGHKNRALSYLPKSNWIIGQPIYRRPIIQLEPKSDKNLSNYTPSNSLQTIDNTELDNRTEDKNPINQLDLKEVLI